MLIVKFKIGSAQQPKSVAFLSSDESPKSGLEMLFISVINGMVQMIVNHLDNLCREVSPGVTLRA